MGNTWKGISDDALVESERTIISFTGIPMEEFQIDNIIIDDKGNFVRTIRIGNVSNIFTSNPMTARQSKVGYGSWLWSFWLDIL